MVLKIKLTTHRIIAAIVFLIAMGVVIATIAPTTSFWDCGEFITASYTLGVPHPPGAPLYLLIGRVFSMIPFAENIGLRVNLVSGLLSALTVLLLYLCIIRMLRAWRGREKTLKDKFTVFGSGVVGALTFAFSHSYWFNAVEAEVYSVSMFFTALVFYMALVWLDYADEPLGNRILLFIFYIVGLSSGIHLLNVLALISVTYIVAFQKREATFKNFIIAGLIGSGIIFAIYPGIIQGIPLVIKKYSVWSLIPIMFTMLYLIIYFIKKDRRIPAFALLSTLLVIVGYSTFLMIKIRSGLDTFLDENDPETWSKLLAYINREQYGTESLFLTMFERKAPFWTYQIKKMYLRYFSWQFIAGPTGANYFAIPFLLGVVGAVHHFYRDSKGAFTVLALFFMTGIAILLYLNQPDPQPRERDYAYVGSFFAFAIWIGIGVAALIDLVGEWSAKLKSMPVAGAVTVACFMAAPVNMFVQNYHTHDRSGNYVAWDYSYNLLNTCAKDAILYTNGDNDTFPLWYLQAVEGVRTDVRVVNLSLLNTGWFVQQIRDKEPKVPLPAKVTDEYISNVIDARDMRGLMDRHWQEKRKVSIDGFTPDSPKLVWEVPSSLTYPVGTGGMEHFLRVQDLMILNTMAANKWKKPIYFAVTVSDANLVGLRDIKNPQNNYLSMEGLAFRLSPEPVPLINAPKIAENMFNVYKYRGVNDSDVYFNDNILKLLGNYRQGLIQLSYEYLTEMTETANTDSTGSELALDTRIAEYSSLPPAVKSLTALDFMERELPEDLIPIKYDVISLQIGRIFAQLNRPHKMAERLDRFVAKGNINAQKAFEYGLYYLSEAKSPEGAKKLFEESLRQNVTFDNYSRIAYTWMQYENDTTYVAEILDRFIELRGDRQTRLKVAQRAASFGLNTYSLGIFKALRAENPNDFDATWGLIDYYNFNKDYQQALDIAVEWLEVHPSDSAIAKKRNELELLIRTKIRNL